VKHPSLRRLFPVALVVAATLAAAPFAAAQTPLGNAFTYQGRLDQSASPANGSYSMVFKLWDSPTGGTQVGPTLTFDGLAGNPAPVNITGGLFTASLDFGAGAFGTNARWLEITIDGVTLSPRQATSPAPAALFSAAPWATSGSSVSYSGGNVGIGTTLPSSALEVSRTTGDAEIGIVGGDGGRRWTLQSSSGVSSFPLEGTFQIIDRTAGASRLTINPAGMVGIGTTDPLRTLTVGGDAEAFGNFDVGGYLAVRGPAVLRGDVDVTGRLGINASGTQYRLQVVGDTRFEGLAQFANGTLQILNSGLQFGTPNQNTDPISIERVDGGSDSSTLVINIGDNPGSNAPPGDDLIIKAGGQIIFIFRSNGLAAKVGDPLWATISDQRAKHEIQPLTGALDQLMQLKGHTFYYNEPNKPGARPGKCIGFIAQDVEPVFPEWVRTDHDGMKSLAMPGIEAITVEALRELRAEKDAQIEALRAEKDAQIEELAAAHAAQVRANEQLAERLARLESLMEKSTAR